MDIARGNFYKTDTADRLPPFSRYQQAIKDLYKLEPDDCLNRIANTLREILNCETVCILLWNDAKQKLITEYESGLPEALHNPEHYRPDEGLTGKIIFSDATWLNCLIDIGNRQIYDQQKKVFLQEVTTKWENMERYDQVSNHGFRNLLGAPLFVRNEKLGAVKLINKLGDDGTLAEDGFGVKDLETLSYFLEAIEHVVEIKRNEKRVQSLLVVGQKIINTGSEFKEILNEIAERCADALNYRVCLIRLIEDKDLHVRASNVDLPSQTLPDIKSTPPAKAVEHRIPLKCTYDGDSKPSQLILESTEDEKKIKLSRPHSSFINFLQQFQLKSFLIVPILDRGHIIGTIECYASLPRGFPTAELNAIRMYIYALVISSIKDRQQLLLTNLIEMQRVSAVTDDAGAQEEKVINSVLSHIRNLLGRRLKTVAVLFSQQRLASAKLNCEEIYGVREKVLKSILGNAEFDALLSELNHPSDGNAFRTVVPGMRKINGKREELEVVRACISPERDRPPLGILFLGTQKSENGDGLPQHVAQLGADCLAVMLANIGEFKRSRGLPAIIRDASRALSQDEIYNLILSQTTGFFGFDFGAIARVDHMSRTIEIVKTKTVKPDLVNPEEWAAQARYTLGSDDILSWVQREKKHEIIDAARPGQRRDKRLNEEIYKQFNHRDLARIWVPFIFRKAGVTGEYEDDLVLGVIEAGYHRDTQDTINKEKSEQFVLFVDSCANTLQRITLLEERKSIDDILERFNQEMNSASRDRKPQRILQKLLEESVNLVRGDWGDITFLTHYDNKIRFLDNTISYNMPPLDRSEFARELEVGETGDTGIIGYVAWLGKAYWSNDVGTEPKYRLECPNVKSELAVPLRFSGRTIGVLNINSNSINWFDERKAELIQTVADQGAVLYHQARVVEPLYTLISPFNPFANPSELYTRVIDIIEEFLRTKTVSIWERIAKGHSEDQFTLKLVRASKGLWEKYGEAKIFQLPQECFTGNAVTTTKVVEVNEEEIKTEFITAKFAADNELRFMTAVPIAVGNECYGAINVFSRRNTKLFPEEVAILQILASKAAVALQSTRLIQSFNEVARIAPGDNVKSVLEGIAKAALIRLHADPVILFRYDAETRQLEPEAIVAGKFHFPEVQIVTTKNEMAKMILELKASRYLESEADYFKFEAEVNRSWHSNRFKSDFWHREKIKSLAALKLEHGGELVGMMFINYREPQVFTDPQKRLMEVFAAQAASVIYNAKTWERNNRYWEMQRADSLSLSVSEIVSSLAHNSGNLVFSTNMRVGRIQEFLNKVSGDTLPKSKIEEMVKSLREPLTELTEDFTRLRRYRQLDELNIQACDVNDLIRQALLMMRVKLDNQRITVDADRLTNSLPPVPCDHNQIQHVILNLFLNAAEAMGNKGTLSVATKVDDGYVQIRISDTGPGIAPENRNKIFSTTFTTKNLKEGSGMGLPISQYIVANHGGRLEFTSTPRKGTSFFVYLPLEDEDSL